MNDFLEELFHFIFDFAIFGFGLLCLLKSIGIMHQMLSAFQQLIGG